MGTTTEDQTLGEILHQLTLLEHRISRIEERLEVEPSAEASSERNAMTSAEETDPDESLEVQIGRIWFAKIGILVLAIGIAFLLTFPYHGLPSVLPAVVGFIVAIGCLVLSSHWQTSLPQLSLYVLVGAAALLFFSTLRLFFFSTQPAVDNRILEFFLLVVTVGISAAIAVRRRSELIAGLTCVFCGITALVGGELAYVVGSLVALCAGAAIVSIRLSWTKVLVFSTIVVLLTHMLWSLNNPAFGNNIHLIEGVGQYSGFLLIYVAILAAGALYRRRPSEESGTVITAAAVNSAGTFGLLVFLTMTLDRGVLGAYYFAASILFLLIAVAFWSRERSTYSTFFYAMTGYMALSAAIVSRFGTPENYVVLAWQSVLVVSTAVWFRSRIIIGANFAIFIILFLAYLFLAGKIGIVSVSFGAVALLTARILNWQKHRLDLHTEMMRNAYLASAFVIFPYALYHTVPGGYVSISWVVIAIFYYIMSIAVKSSKYRWMSLLTLCLAAGYVLLVDIGSLDPTYRIVSFLVLGGVLFMVSFLYARRKTSLPANEERMATNQEKGKVL